MDDNTFQAQLDTFFGGSTGNSLGPDVVNSALTNTTSPSFKVGYTSSNDFRGVQTGASVGAPNTAFLDFNSLNGGTNDFDTRILAFAGEAGVNGRAGLILQADSFTFSGNASNATPLMTQTGNTFQPGGAEYFDVSTNQGRMLSLLHVAWSGEIGYDGTNPALVIQLRDPVTSAPWYGQFFVSLSNGYIGAAIWQATMTVSKDQTPAQNIVVAQEVEGNDLANIYATITYGIAGNPVLNFYNKIGAGTTARYMVTGTVFPLNDGF